MSKTKNDDRPDFLVLLAEAHAAGPRGPLREAQLATAPQITDLEQFLEQIDSHKAKWAAPVEPTAEECHALDQQIVAAWRAGKDGRAVIDKWEHPWLTPERRQQFTAARFVRAQSSIRDELDAATRPSDDQIRWLSDELISVFQLTTQFSHDRNAENLWIERYAQLFGAWEGVIRKTAGGRLEGPFNVDAAALFSNAEEISPRHLAILRGDMNPPEDPWSPRHTRDRAVQLFNTSGAELWLPTFDQWTTKQKEMRDAEWDAASDRQAQRPKSRPVTVPARLR